MTKEKTIMRKTAGYLLKMIINYPLTNEITQFIIISNDNRYQLFVGRKED